MSFSLESSAIWGFTYNANLLDVYPSGETHITNPNTEPTIYGKFLAWSSECPDEDFIFIENWFNSSGLLATCKLFNNIPLAGLDCGSGLVWKAFITPAQAPILRSFYNGVQTPYRITCAYPVSSLSHTISGDDIVGVPNTQIDLTFKFKIVPEANYYTFSEKGNAIQFSDIPFKVIPRKVIYPNPGGGGYGNA